MSWQSVIYELLRDREWHSVGVLFELVEQDIPLHHAMRRYLGTGKNRQMPTNTEARWLYFKSTLGLIGIEVNGGKLRGLKWNSEIRLSYLEGVQCEECGGPVIKRNWSGYVYTCLACANKPEPITFPCVITVPQDLISYKTLVAVWKADAKLPPLPKQKRKRKRRPKIQRVPTPRLVAPPVIVEEPKLVKAAVAPPGRPVPQRPIKRPILRLKPKPEGELPVSIMKDIWQTFIRITPIPQFDHDPKLRRYLRRTLEAGVLNEYSNMKGSIVKESLELSWPNQDIANKVIAHRAAKWIDANISQQYRKRWVIPLLQAYTSGSMAIIAITVNGNLPLVCEEMEKAISKKRPKAPPPGKPPQPARLRWGAPFRQARNVLNRYFSR